MGGVSPLYGEHEESTLAFPCGHERSPENTRTAYERFGWHGGVYVRTRCRRCHNAMCRTIMREKRSLPAPKGDAWFVERLLA